MALYEVRIDAHRGTSKTAPPKRTTLTYLVDAETSDAAEASAMKAASGFTAGYKQRAVEWRVTFGPIKTPICVKKSNKGIWA